MADIPIKDGLSDCQRHRPIRQATAMKLPRLRVPDPRTPGFREEANRQAMKLRDAPEEREALDFIEAAFKPADHPE